METDAPENKEPLSNGTSRPSLAVVHDLAKALLQIEQAVEKRFLRTPLGECQKTPDKRRATVKAKQQTIATNHHHHHHNHHNHHHHHHSHHESSDTDDAHSTSTKYQVLHHWEKSLLNATTLSQLFIHLQSLDESIAWSKSAMNARCRLCRRKGDAEKMLLCDKCDRGHHIYCLRPPLKSVPDGEWFCPECRPKDNEKTPRKIRQSFMNTNGDEDTTAEVEAGNEDDLYSCEEDETNKDDSDATDAKSDSVKRQKTTNEDDDDDGDDVDDDDDSNDTSTVDGDDDDDDDANDNDADDTYDEETNTDDNNDEKKPRLTTKPKIKLNGKHINPTTKSKSDLFSDEDTVIEESSDEAEAKRKNRKRKMTEEIPTTGSTLKAKNKNASWTDMTTSSSSKLSETTNDSKLGRNGRGRLKPNYNEMSDDVSGTDDDSHKSSKRMRTQSSKMMQSDFYTNNTSSRNTEMSHRLKVAEKLLNDMMKQPDAWPFLKPVSRREAPDYFEVIKRPMDLSTIKNNLNNFKYTDYTKMIEDTRLVFQNCRTYNEPGSDIYRTGERLLHYFESHAKQVGLLDTKQLVATQLSSN